MFKVNVASKFDMSVIFSNSLKLCLRRSLPCASRRPISRNYVGPLHVVQNRIQRDSPSLLRNLVRFSDISVRPQSNSSDIGTEKDGEIADEVSFDKPIPKDKLNALLKDFAARPMLHQLEEEYGIDSSMSRRAMTGFKKWCLNTEELPQDIHIVIWDILQESAHVDDLFPFYLKHARMMFPELECMEDLRKISDLTEPTSWYPEARSKQRKVIYHAGPTNSGKTYHALQRFLGAKSGIYCGPLRLLAVENFKKSNERGTPCDLITGEERKYVNESGEPANHHACTVEMTNFSQPYEVAIIDEIQMLRDPNRGWAFTRAFLGVCADEVHVCGEEACVDLVRDLTVSTGDTFEVKRYKRLTKLKILDRGIDSFDKIRPGDCIVCFNKKNIFSITRELERRGIEVAVIYGTLPPGTKLAQADKFNDPNDPCKVLVATDAIGMGINLSIKRMIFYSLIKPTVNHHGEKDCEIISVPAALQIAGRAGRFQTQFHDGEVTTFQTRDLQTLVKLLNSPVEQVQKAGLGPTAEQVEKFAFHLPKKSLTDLIDMFVHLCELDDSKYFMCQMGDFKFLANMIQHVPLDIKVRYTFCCAPISMKHTFACGMFLKFARRFSEGHPLTLSWVTHHLGYPFQVPMNLKELVLLENVFDVIDLYLWLSYRFPSMFPDVEQMRLLQGELDKTIQSGVQNIISSLTKEDLRSMYLKSSFNDEDKMKKDRSIKSLLSRKEEMQLENVALKAGERVSEQLVKSGILTPDVIKILRQEFHSKNQKKAVPKDDPTTDK